MPALCDTHCVRRAPKVAFTLLLGAWGVSCAPVVETPVRARESFVCDADDVGAYVVDLFRAPPGETFACAACARPGGCERLARRCVCTEPHEASEERIDRYLGGVRFEGLDPDDGHCVRIVGVEDMRWLSGDPPAFECACEGVWEEPAALLEVGQVCLHNWNDTPVALGEGARIVLDAACQPATEFGTCAAGP